MQLLKDVQSEGRLSRDELLDRLVTRASLRAFRIAHSLLRDAAEAEDAVQEALVTVCKSHASLRDETMAEAWFLRIVTTSCLRQLRRRRMKEVLLGSLSSSKAPASAKDGEQLLGESQEAQLLLRYLQVLPTMQRSALILRYGHDMPVAELAKLMNIKPSSAKTHLVRGMRRIRELLRREGEIV